MFLPIHHIFPIVCKAFCLAAMVVVCAGCRKDESEEVSPEDAPHGMRFAANVMPTRASGSPLQDAYTSFLVHAFKTMSDDPVQTVMPGYVVEYDADNEYYGSHWHYEDVNGQYLKYWDPSAAKYTFAAIAPVPGEDSNLTMTVDENGDMRLQGLPANVSTGDYDNSSNSTDWVVAKTIRTMGALKDEDGIDHTLFTTPSSKFDEVPLNFHHIYAKVDIKVYAAKPITILTFTMKIPEGSNDEIPNKGNYDVAEAKWSIVGVEQNDWLKRFADYTYLSRKPIPEGEDNAIVLCSHLQMPQDFPKSGRVFNISFTDVNGNTYSGSITLNADNNGTNSWERNTHYTYTLKINNNEGTSEVILFAVDMETWKWQEGSSKEDEQHNW